VRAGPGRVEIPHLRFASSAPPWGGRAAAASALIAGRQGAAGRRRPAVRAGDRQRAGKTGETVWSWPRRPADALSAAASPASGDDDSVPVRGRPTAVPRSRRPDRVDHDAAKAAVAQLAVDGVSYGSADDTEAAGRLHDAVADLASGRRRCPTAAGRARAAANSPSVHSWRGSRPRRPSLAASRRRAGGPALASGDAARRTSAAGLRRASGRLLDAGRRGRPAGGHRRGRQVRDRAGLGAPHRVPVPTTAADRQRSTAGPLPQLPAPGPGRLSPVHRSSPPSSSARCQEGPLTTLNVSIGHLIFGRRGQ